METVRIDLRNCYGIRKMHHEFSFRRQNACIVYAQNGSMKTSLAKVFKALSEGGEPEDRLFPHRETKWSVKDETGTLLSPETILVLESNEEKTDRTAPIATLLANEELRAEFQQAHESIDAANQKLLKELQKTSGLKKSVAEELKSVFGEDRDTFNDAVRAALASLSTHGDPGMAQVKYADIFNDKVLSFLDDPAVQQQLSEYLARYNELLADSRFFRKGVFTHNNAFSVAKALNDHAFFRANHRVGLSDQDGNLAEITSAQELDEQLLAEKNRIWHDPDLRKRLDELDTRITKNNELRTFRQVLENNPEVVAMLGDLDWLRRTLWISYLAGMQGEAQGGLEAYEAGRARIEDLVNRARSETNAWQEVVDVFNRRFNVPFELMVENQEDVTLRQEAPSIVFRYRDGHEYADVARGDLMNVLSMGERRALYLLNILFELRARQTEGGELLVVIDDIADSFDYKNKYAIVQYLQDILRTPSFKALILTHNYDFFRTVCSRLGLKGRQSYMAARAPSGITLTKANHETPLSRWKTSMEQEDVCLLALIPMARNIVEYTKGTDDTEYIHLTSCLHRKPDTAYLTMTDVIERLNRVLNTTGARDDRTYLDVLYGEAERSLDRASDSALETKVVLSIAIRLRAEEFMMHELGYTEPPNDLGRHQMRELIKRYQAHVAQRGSASPVLDRVHLMTPEAIHLNSFMYEPLVDMSIEELSSLYMEVRALVERPGS